MRAREAVEYLRSDLEGFIGEFTVEPRSENEIALISDFGIYKAWLPHNNSPFCDLKYEWVKDASHTKAVPS